MARVDEYIHKVVVALDFAMRHAPGEYHLIGNAQGERLTLQRRFLRPPAHQEQAKIRQALQDLRKSRDQQIKSLICVKRTNKSSKCLPGKAEPFLECIVGSPAHR